MGVLSIIFNVATDHGNLNSSSGNWCYQVIYTEILQQVEEI